MQPYLALITPISSGGGEPSHPIAPGGPPLGIWGGRPPNYVDIGGPGNQPGLWPGQPPYVDIGFPGPQPGAGRPTHPIYYPPYPSQGPGFPTHPIAPGGQPPGIWGGRPPWIDNTLPGPQPGQPPGIWGGPWQPPYPSTGPGFPTNPIVLPPIEPGGPPVVIWGGSGSLPGMQPHPSHPIVIPPLPPPPEGGGVKPPPEDGGWGYAPGVGWGYFPGTGGVAGPKK